MCGLACFERGLDNRQLQVWRRCDDGVAVRSKTATTAPKEVSVDADTATVTSLLATPRAFLDGCFRPGCPAPTSAAPAFSKQLPWTTSQMVLCYQPSGVSGSFRMTFSKTHGTRLLQMIRRALTLWRVSRQKTSCTRVCSSFWLVIFHW